MPFKEHDIVEVVNLIDIIRQIDGTEKVMRQPRIGDVGAIVNILKDAENDSMYIVESVDNNGMTIWLSDFHQSELKIKS